MAELSTGVYSLLQIILGVVVVLAGMVGGTVAFVAMFRKVI